MGADCSSRVQIKPGIGMDMILEMVNTTKIQAGFTREILIKVFWHFSKILVHFLMMSNFRIPDLKSTDKLRLKCFSTSVVSNGGNSIRFWLHPVGSGSCPKWDKNGYVTGTDKSNTLIDELRFVFHDIYFQNYLKPRKFFLDYFWTMLNQKMF